MHNFLNFFSSTNDDHKVALSVLSLAVTAFLIYFIASSVSSAPTSRGIQHSCQSWRQSQTGEHGETGETVEANRDYKKER